MTKAKSSASSIVFLSIFVIHLINSAQPSNATWVTWCPKIAISPLTKM